MIRQVPHSAQPLVPSRLSLGGMWQLGQSETTWWISGSRLIE